MKKPTNKQMSAALGITIRRITELKRAGMPTDTTEAAQSWRNDREHGDDSVKRLRIERIALVSEQRRRAQIENRVRLGGLVDAGQVKQSMTRVCSVARGQFLRLPHELPPRLAGLAEPKMQAIIHEAIVEILTTLSDETSALYREETPAAK